MTSYKRILSLSKSKALSLLVIAAVPLMTGCIGALSAATFGTVFWLDLALIPVRSALGGLALDFVNTN